MWKSLAVKVREQPLPFESDGFYPLIPGRTVWGKGAPKVGAGSGRCLALPPVGRESGTSHFGEGGQRLCGLHTGRERELQTGLGRGH